MKTIQSSVYLNNLLSITFIVRKLYMDNWCTSLFLHASFARKGYSKTREISFIILKTYLIHNFFRDNIICSGKVRSSCSFLRIYLNSVNILICLFLEKSLGIIIRYKQFVISSCVYPEFEQTLFKAWYIVPVYYWGLDVAL